MQILELIILGVATGFLSGFFGIGGGTFLVPSLLVLDFDMKSAVAISIMQMVFSSIFGSFLNVKKAKSVLNDGIIIGIGGFIGGLQSGFIVENVPTLFLKYIFILILILSILKIFTAPAQVDDIQIKSKNNLILVAIGFFIGMISMSIGIGGSILLTPLLITFLRYDLKSATALGLFFVIFSSVAGFISNTIHGNTLFYEGSIIGLASLIGVYFGIKIKEKIHLTSYKKYILILYVTILCIMVYKTFF